MKKVIFLLISQCVMSQTIGQKLDTALKSVMKTPQGSVANWSLYVSDNQGNVVYECNASKGLSTASTQKIFTAAMALETLGSDYLYTTSAAASGNLSEGVLEGNLYLYSTGDPTLGSWRYEGYKPENFLKRLSEAVKNHGISKINGDLVLDDSYFDFQNIPGGWPWNDIGNYYGAGVWGINWRENQFDINMNGDQMKGLNIELPNVTWVNDIKVAGTSDKSLVYTAPHLSVAYIQGTLPAKPMVVSGANPNPVKSLGVEIVEYFKTSGIEFGGKIITISEQRAKGETPTTYPSENTFFTYTSPSLDKMVHWFLRKSINFYGETFVKTMAKEKKGNPSFSTGMDYMKEFWKGKGINPYMINFADGSGLSPQNYVSAKAEVQALLWAKKQAWYPVYYEAFPVQTNGMKMKSGTIKDVKSFAGYHKGYTFSIIVNNYQGNAVEALYKVLNVLK